MTAAILASPALAAETHRERVSRQRAAVRAERSRKGVIDQRRNPLSWATG